MRERSKRGKRSKRRESKVINDEEGKSKKRSGKKGKGRGRKAEQKAREEWKVKKK